MFELECALPASLKAQLTSDAQATFGSSDDLLLHAYLPGLEILRTSKANPDIRISHHESETPRLDRSGTHLDLFDLWKDKLSPDLYHLFYSAARVRFMEQGFYSVHAACVGEEEQVLVVGHSGSGKTTTALEMVLKHDWKIASGNKTLVAFDPHNQLHVQAGTEAMTVRQHSGEQYANTLSDTVHSYGNRLAFRLDSSHYVSLAQQRIRAIALVKLDEAQRDAHELHPQNALHTLYPYFMDTVNADTIVCAGKAIFEGTPPTGAAQKLASNLSQTVSRIPVYSIAGPLSYLIETIADI